jgi:hypothetical protein
MNLQREDIHPVQDTCPYFGSNCIENPWFDPAPLVADRFLRSHKLDPIGR